VREQSEVDAIFAPTLLEEMSRIGRLGERWVNFTYSGLISSNNPMTSVCVVALSTWTLSGGVATGVTVAIKMCFLIQIRRILVKRMVSNWQLLTFWWDLNFPVEVIYSSNSAGKLLAGSQVSILTPEQKGEFDSVISM